MTSDKTNVEEKIQMAVDKFNNGFNCAQAVLSVFSEELGLDMQTALKIGTCFGSGMKCGEVCGVVSGALMAIGLKHGQYMPNDSAIKEYSTKLACNFTEEFKRRNHSLLCREILGLNPGVPDEKQKITELGLFHTICPEKIACAVEMVHEIFETEKTDIIIRQMTESDWPAVAEIYRQGIATGKATFQYEIPAYSEWNAGHIAECRSTACEGEKVVGWVALSKVSGRPVYAGVAEVSIYIAESARGKGVGKQLMNHLIRESEKAGFWLLQSGIMEDNEPSICLHEGCGFRKVGLREKIGKDVNGEWRSTVLMERRSSVTGID